MCHSYTTYYIKIYRDLEFFKMTHSRQFCYILNYMYMHVVCFNVLNFYILLLGVLLNSRLIVLYFIFRLNSTAMIIHV